MPENTGAAVCRDCPTLLIRKTAGRRGPIRCPKCAHSRHVAQGKVRGAARTRPSRAKPPEPPRPCADCPTLVHKAKTKWPERCEPCATKRRRKAHREQLAARAKRRREQTVPCADCGVEAAIGYRLVKNHRCDDCKRIQKNDRYRRARAENPVRFREAEVRWAAANPDVVARKRDRRRFGGLDIEWEDFLNAEIFERDGWVCQVPICRKPVDRSLRWPDTGSASLDHKIPLTRDGTSHTRLNVRLAHLSCNISKGNRLDEELELLAV